MLYIAGHSSTSACREMSQALSLRAQVLHQRIDLRRDAAFQFVDVAPPPVVVAPGLSTTRRQYLFKTVRPFVREAFQDLTCPAPDI